MDDASLQQGLESIIHIIELAFHVGELSALIGSNLHVAENLFVQCVKAVVDSFKFLVVVFYLVLQVLEF